MEVDEEGNTVGPVDADHNPVEGHPEYQRRLPSPTIVMESEVQPQEEPAILKEYIPVTISEKEIPLEEVLLETEIGGLLFEPELALLAGRSFVMAFDMNRSKPPLYPRVGSNFRLKYKQHDLPVTYMDISFKYNDKRFMVFIVLDDEEF